MILDLSANDSYMILVMAAFFLLALVHPLMSCIIYLGFRIYFNIRLIFLLT